MDSWLSSLKDLLDIRNSAKLSLPGAVCAAFLAVFFWPPKPIDVIPVVRTESNGEQAGSSLAPSIAPGGDAKEGPLGGKVGQVLEPITRDPACIIDVYQLNPVSWKTGILFKTSREIARQRQYLLEKEGENLERCMAEEKRLQGVEQGASAALQRDLAVLEASMGKQVAVLAAYEKVDSPMTSSARNRWKQDEKVIDAKRDEIGRLEQDARNRDWEIAELARWKAAVVDRLADPGRLRPEMGFDDYLSALSKHVLAFIFLAVAVGMVLEGIATPSILAIFDSTLFGG